MKYFNITIVFIMISFCAGNSFSADSISSKNKNEADDLLSFDVREYIKGAINNSPDVQERIYNKNESQNLLKKSYRSALPVITAAAGVGSQYTNNRAASPSTSKFGTETTSLDLHQNIFGEGNFTDIKFSKSIFNSKLEELEQIKNLITLSTIEDYLNIIRYELIIAIQEKSIISHQDVLDKTKSRLEVGLSRASDLSLAKARLALANSNLLATKSRLERSYNALYRHSGLSKRGKLIDFASGELPASFEDAWEITLKNNPILKAKHHEITTARFANKKDKIDLYPSVSFDASASKTYDDNGVQGINEELSAMLNLRYRFNFGSKIHQKKSSESRIGLKRSEYKKSQSDIYQNLSSLYSDYYYLKERMTFIKSNRDNLSDVVEKHQKEFEAGFRGLFDLLNTKSEFFGSEIQYINTLYDKKILTYNILANSGTLLKYFGN